MNQPGMSPPPPPPFAPTGAVQTQSRCEACGVPAETRMVTLRQNIGALVMRFPRTVQGSLCRDCIGKYFWKYTLTTAVLGWWGVISFFCTLAWIPANIAAFVSSRSLPPPKRDGMP
jgi:hypothetical protein